MLDFLFNLKPYPYEAGWEPRKRMLINVILCLICGFCFGYVRYIEDLLFARGITLPTIHSLCVCIFLTGLFLPYTLYKHGKTNFAYMITKRSWIVLIYVSFELVAYLSFAQSRGIGSYLALSLLQGMIPCLLLIATYFVLKARYTLFHYIGILASLIGVALLIGGNQIAGRNYVNSKEASTLSGAIILSIVSPVFYTATYITLEAGLRQYYLEEILGLYGLYGIASNLFYTGLMNPWENFDGFTVETTPLFILAVILRSIGTIGLFILAKSENSILSGLAYITIEFFYIVVSNLYGNSPYRIHVLHFIGFGVGVIAIILYTLKSPTYEIDVTEKINFYKRPSIPYNDEPDQINIDNNNNNNNNNNTYDNDYDNSKGNFYQETMYNTMSSHKTSNHSKENSSISYIPPPIVHMSNQITDINDSNTQYISNTQYTSSTQHISNTQYTSSYKTESTNEFHELKQGLNHRTVNQAAKEHLFG